MAAQIVCPSCKKAYSDMSIIDEAATGQGSAMQVIACDCGERITYWQITAQIREQNKFSRRFKNWIQARVHS